MKKLLLSVLYCVTVFTSQPLKAADSMEDLLKDSSTGELASKFRGGFFLGGGYQGTAGGDGDTKIQGTNNWL